MKKLEKTYRFDIRDFNSGKFTEALKQIKQKYKIGEEQESFYGNRKKVRNIEAEWINDTTYEIKVFVEKRNKWKDDLKVRGQGATRKEILQNRDMIRDLNSAIENKTYQDIQYGNWQNAKKYQPNTRYNSGWSR